jgi:hypothetical protein
MTKTCPKCGATYNVTVRYSGNVALDIILKCCAEEE